MQSFKINILNQAVTISAFHYTIIVAKRIHADNIIAILIENLKTFYNQIHL